MSSEVVIVVEHTERVKVHNYTFPFPLRIVVVVEAQSVFIKSGRWGQHWRKTERPETKNDAKYELHAGRKYA